MRKILLVLLVIGLVGLSVGPAVAVSVSWNKVYGGVIQTGGGKIIEDERYFSMQLNAPLNSTLVRRANGEYLLRAHPGKAVASAFRTYRVNAVGKNLGTILNSPIAIQNTPDGGFVSVSSVNSAYKQTAYVVSKYNKNNALVWKKTIPVEAPKNSLDINAIAVTKNGEIVVGGGEFGAEADKYRVVLKKFTANGAFVWSKILVAGNLTPMINSIRPTMDGGVIVSGQRDVEVAGASVAFVMIVDADGAVNLDKEIVSCNEAAVDAVQLSNGSVIVVSNVLQSYSVDPKIWDYITNRTFWATRVSVFSATGTMQTERFVQAMFPTDTVADLCNSFSKLTENEMLVEPVSIKSSMIQPTADGGFLLTGTRSAGIKIKKQKDQMWVTKLDAELGTVWEKEFASGDNQYGYVGLEKAPGEYVVAGVNKKGQRVVQTFIK